MEIKDGEKSEVENKMEVKQKEKLEIESFENFQLDANETNEEILDKMEKLPIPFE